MGKLFCRQYQRKTHISFAHGAESIAGGTDDACFFYQRIPEIHGALKIGRDGGPYEHRSFGIRYVPADASEAAAQSIPTALILGTLGFHGLSRAGKGCNSAVLNRHEHPKIILGTDDFKRVNDFFIAHGKGNSCSCRIKGLGEGKEFDTHFLGSGQGKEGKALQSVKEDITVGVIVN